MYVTVERNACRSKSFAAKKDFKHLIFIKMRASYKNLLYLNVESISLTKIKSITAFFYLDANLKGALSKHLNTFSIFWKSSNLPLATLIKLCLSRAGTSLNCNSTTRSSMQGLNRSWDGIKNQI